VLPRRIRQHDPGRHARLGHVPRRVALARALPARRLLLAGAEGLHPALLLPLVPGHLPALPLRPDHAPRLAGGPAAHDSLHRRARRLDADAALDMVEVMLARLRDFFGTFLLVELVKGMVLTGRHFFARKVTVLYPEEKTPTSPRFRGL